MVQWDKENKYSVVPLSSFDYDKNKLYELEEGEIYTVKFDGKKYKAMLLLLATKTACNKKLKFVTSKFPSTPSHLNKSKLKKD